MSSANVQTNISFECTLYRFVFASRLVWYSVLLLLVSLVLQPVQQAFADEITTPTESATAEVALEPEPEPIVADTPEPAEEESTTAEQNETVAGSELSQEETVLNETAAENEPDTVTNSDEDNSTDSSGALSATLNKSTSTEVAVSAGATTKSSTTATAVSDDNKASTSLVSATTTTTVAGSASSSNVGTISTTTTVTSQDNSTSSATTASVASSTTSPVASESGTETTVSSASDNTVANTTSTVTGQTTVQTKSITNQTEPIDSETTDTASTSEPAGVPLTSTHTSDSNKYQFAETECVEVEDGSFYCTQSDVSSQNTLSDTLYAAVDAQGDKEIYLRVNGKTKQLSNNTLDDSAPHYDSVSNTVVWHRIIAGRYQIVSYDLDTETEMVLTSGSQNNMEPTRAGEYTVWQRWVESSWEIVLFNGETVTQLTENNYHDVAPSIRNGFVIWHTNDGDKREVMVYEITTGQTSTIADDEAGQVKNPRFVLMYDTVHTNGDIITKGYDFASGSVVPLAAQPGELPEEIPSPEPTEETRALIQNKSSLEEEDGLTTVTETGSTTPNKASSTPSTATNLELDLSKPASTTETTTFDVVVTPYEKSSSTQASRSTSTSSSVE